MIWLIKGFKLILFFVVCYLGIVSVSNGLATLSFDIPFTLERPEEPHPWFCWLPGLLIGIALAHTVDWLSNLGIVWAIYRIMPLIPIEWQRPFYNTWKEKVIIGTQNASPLIAYPMLAFIELELDKHFEENGFRYAEQMLFKKSEEVGENLMKGFTEIGEEALARNQARKTRQEELDKLLVIDENIEEDWIKIGREKYLKEKQEGGK